MKPAIVLSKVVFPEPFLPIHKQFKHDDLNEVLRSENTTLLLPLSMVRLLRFKHRSSQVKTLHDSYFYIIIKQKSCK
jgi:hypothetical protein